MKLIQGEADGDTDPGVLMSAQTITSETSSTTTTTHITKVQDHPDRKSDVIMTDVSLLMFCVCVCV